jgi:hypothetical protein
VRPRSCSSAASGVNLTGILAINVPHSCSIRARRSPSSSVSRQAGCSASISHHYLPSSLFDTLPVSGESWLPAISPTTENRVVFSLTHLSWKKKKEKREKIR